MEHDVFYQKLSKATAADDVNLEQFVRMLIEEDSTEQDWTDEIWHKVLPLLADKLPARVFETSVSEAAKLKVCTTDAIRKAIVRGDLVASKQGSRWRIDTESLAKWSPGRQGGRLSAHTHKVEFSFGRQDDVYFAVRVDGQKLPHVSQDGQIFSAQLDQWSSIGVYTSTKHGRRFMVLEPSIKTNEITLEQFFVHGRFQFARKVNSSKKADAAWANYQNE